MAPTPALDAIEADALGHATWMLARIQQLDAAIPPGTPTSGACRWCSVGDGWRCRLVRRTGCTATTATCSRPPQENGPAALVEPERRDHPTRERVAR